VAAPFSTVQAALDAGFSHVYLTATSLEDVVAPGFVFLTGTDRVVGIRSLTLPDDSGAILDNVSVAPGSLVAGDRCQVITNASVRTAVFGDNGFLVLNGPGALSFVFLTSQLTLGALTMGASGTVLATNTLCTSGTTISANAVEMFGCTCRSSVTANSFEAQSSHLTIGTYTTTGPVNLQNVKCSAGVAFDNALGQAFNLDGFSNYWIKTNGVTLTNAGEKVITDDLTP
jgi:hypothetical protein